MLDTIYRSGVHRIWEEDKLSQLNYVKSCLAARNTPPLDLESLMSFFIPNDEYVINYFGSDILLPEYGFYDERHMCFWDNCLVLPIFNVADKVTSVVGFNPFRYVEAREKQDWSINYYIYADSRHFRKSSYMFYTEGVYRSAMRDGFLFVTDGVFDTVSLQLAGFNSAAFLGSFVTAEISAMLRFINHVIAVIDNDEAGQKLAGALKRVHPNVTIVSQRCTKDIDELLRSNNRNQVISELKNAQQFSGSYYTLNVR